MVASVLRSKSFPILFSRSEWSRFGDSCALDDEWQSFRNARRVAEYYSARFNQTLEEREASPIFHSRKLNNWDAVDCPKWIVSFHVFKSLIRDPRGVFYACFSDFGSPWFDSCRHIMQEEWDIYSIPLFGIHVEEESGQVQLGETAAQTKEKMYITEDDIQFISS